MSLAPHPLLSMSSRPQRAARRAGTQPLLDEVREVRVVRGLKNLGPGSALRAVRDDTFSYAMALTSGRVAA
jgi:hypothetical protein